ncbi:MAG: protein kinase [Nostoc sp. RI_552]|nr:protein kinase [Nostoc sp. RI_552]
MRVYCSRQHSNIGGNRFCIHCGDPFPLAFGEVVDDRYRIIRQLGQGGFGRTYLAEDNYKSQQPCVLKEFAPQVTTQQDLQKAKELFEREANVLKTLQHPQIPRFRASLQVLVGSKDFFFLVQDYIDGSSYYQLLEQRQGQGKNFTEEEVITMLEQILPVLSYIHSRDVVHRDISPDNLIWRSSDHLPMLIDFGGVKQLTGFQGLWFTRLAVNNTLLGKKGYAPEEQLRQGKVFFNSDLYSLAVTALVLLTGKEPQKLYNTYEGIWHWGKEIKVSSQLEGVLKKMLAHRPSDRYQTAEQVLEDLPSSIKIKPPTTYLTKMKTMVVAPGQILSKIHNKAKILDKSITLPVWISPFAVSLAGTTLVVLTSAGIWAIANSILRNVTSTTVPTISIPKIPSLPNPMARPVSDRGSDGITEILSHREQLQIPEGFFTEFVDNLFYAQKPELNGRSLSSGPEDALLRDEWISMAEDLLYKIKRANLSTPDRRQLGSYSSKNEKIWREQARAGQWGNYTINQLNKDTNEKFEQLFPGQQPGKMNPRTLGQIWYALATDQVSKVKIR